MEVADIDREPLVGSRKVLNRIVSEAGPFDSKQEFFDLQYSAAELYVDGQHVAPLKEIEVEVNVGDIR